MFAGDDHENEEIYIKDTKLLKEKYGVDTIYIKRMMCPLRRYENVSVHSSRAVMGR